MDMNIRNVPEALISLIREHANKRNLTLRNYIISKLSKAVHYRGPDSQGTYVRCDKCGARRKSM
jgi:hypothetical protein